MGKVRPMAESTFSGDAIVLNDEMSEGDLKLVSEIVVDTLLEMGMEEMVSFEWAIHVERIIEEEV